MTGKFYNDNGQLKDISSFPGMTSHSVYEVLRIIEGKPLFWKQHFQRLEHSLKLNNWNDVTLSENEILKRTRDLVETNHVDFSNLRIIITPASDGEHHVELVQFETLMPEHQLYLDGVKTELFELERPHPNAKNVLPDIRKKVEAKMNETQCWELLLVNNKGYITEGSRTNVFFIQNKTWITPPVKQVLPGITRGEILNLCKASGMKVEEREVSAKELHEFEGMVLTGTTPGIIPVQTTGDHKFNPQLPSIQALTEAYKEGMIKDIQHFNFPV